MDIFTFSGTENCCLIPPADNIAEHDWYVLSLSITAILPVRHIEVFIIVRSVEGSQRNSRNERFLSADNKHEVYCIISDVADLAAFLRNGTRSTNRLVLHRW